MDLFEQLADRPSNLLPRDCIADYYGPILQPNVADHYFTILLNEIDWQHDKSNIFGRNIVTKRKVALYGDTDFSYTYSNATKTAKSWTSALLELKDIVERESGERFNSCLLNLYHNGSEGMAWHSDSERDLRKNGAIASLSFGAERKFSFKHKKTKNIISKVLENGSLLVMKGETQTHWLHRLPPTQISHTDRVNLTFRTIETH